MRDIEDGARHGRSRKGMLRSRRWIFGCIAAFGWTPVAAAQAPRPLVCESSVAPAYSDTGRIVTWYVIVEPEEFSRIKADSSLYDMFYDWIRATNQYGRWNSIWSDKIQCSDYVGSHHRQGPGVYGRSELRRANLPRDWLSRSPDEYPENELARFLRGGGGTAEPAEGIGLVVEAGPAPTDLAAVRLQMQRDRAAQMARTAAESLRVNAEMKAKIAKIVEETRKRGMAQ